MDEEPRGKIEISTEGPRPMSPLNRFLLTAGGVAGIVLVTGYFAVRTDGGRSFIEERLEKRLGMPVTIRETSVGWPYDLVMEDVATTGGADAGAFRVQTLRVGWRIGAGVRIAMDRPELDLVRNVEGGWVPARFAKLGELPQQGIRDISRLTAGFRKKTVLKLRDGRIRWTNAEGITLADAEGVRLDIAPIRLPSRRMIHHALGVYSGMGVDGLRFHDLEREWLADEMNPYVEIRGSKQREPAAGFLLGDTEDDRQTDSSAAP